MAGGNIPANLRPVFIQAGRQYGIPPQVLAGVASVETNLGQNRGPSSAGAIGLMQFEPGTARSIGINPLDDRQAIFGAAKLLTQYGYHQNPTRAIGAYNGGPGNPQYGYAQQVLAEAGRLKGELGGGGSAGPSMPGGPAPPALPGVPSTFTQQVFDRKGYDKANSRYLLGQFLQSSGKSAFDIGPRIPGMSSENPLFATGLLPTQAPSPQDFSSTRIVQAAQNSLQQLAGGSGLSVHPGAVPGYKGYVNPLPGFSIGRTDMGVDASARPGTPIRAIGDSKVVERVNGWYAGQPLYLFQFLNGPKAGQYWYVAEQITPHVSPGQIVHAGDTVATFAPSGTGIEIGYGDPRSNSRTLASAQGNTGDASHNNAPAGIAFRQLLNQLGAR